MAGLGNSLLQLTVNRSPECMVAVFVTHIRPIFDYCACVWNVRYVGDVTLLESVWTKKIVLMSNLSYEESLRSLKLFSIKGSVVGFPLLLNDCIYGTFILL